MSRARVYAIVLSIAGVVLVLDQWTKQLALDALDGGEQVALIPGVLSLRLSYNAGGAFGILQDSPGFFTLATCLVIGAILVWAGRVGSAGPAVPLGLILGGGLGNLADRVVRDLGGRVVDFIHLHFWPTFNIADAAIVTGVGLALLMTMRAERTQEAGART